MGTTFLLLSEQGLQCLTIKKSKKHIKFLEKSTYPWLPAFIAAYTSSYNKFLMPFADKRSNGMSDWNKYKSQFVSLQKDSWSRPLQKIFTFRKCHCKYTTKFICLNHDASQPHPKCHLGKRSSLSNVTQLKLINTITSLGTAKGHTLKSTPWCFSRACGTPWLWTESIELPSGLKTLPLSLCKQKGTVSECYS